VYLLAVAKPIARKEASFIDVSSCSWTPLSTCYKLLEIECLLYTGVTREKQLVVGIGQPRALAIAVRNVRATQRLTNLAARLRQGM